MAEKRKGPGRPNKTATPAKKAKIATPTPITTPKEQTPEVKVEPEKDITPLPNRIYDSRPLPTLSECQPLNLPDDEYQSISARYDVRPCHIELLCCRTLTYGIAECLPPHSTGHARNGYQALSLRDTGPKHRRAKTPLLRHPTTRRKTG